MHISTHMLFARLYVDHIIAYAFHVGVSRPCLVCIPGWDEGILKKKHICIYYCRVFLRWSCERVHFPPVYIMSSEQSTPSCSTVRPCSVVTPPKTPQCQHEAVGFDNNITKPSGTRARWADDRAQVCQKALPPTFVPKRIFDTRRALGARPVYAPKSA